MVFNFLSYYIANIYCQVSPFFPSLFLLTLAPVSIALDIKLTLNFGRSHPRTVKICHYKTSIVITVYGFYRLEFGKCPRTTTVNIVRLYPTHNDWPPKTPDNLEGWFSLLKVPRGLERWGENQNP